VEQIIPDAIEYDSYSTGEEMTKMLQNRPFMIVFS